MKEFSEAEDNYKEFYFMNTKIKRVFLDFHMEEKLNSIHEIAHEIIKTSKPYESPCYSLMPLSLALLEAEDLFKIFSLCDDLMLKNLFKGDDELSPNIDTRLRCIRDLCSASVYALMKRAEESDSSASILMHNTSKSIDEKTWMEIFKHYTKPEYCVELARLLDDILEAILSISDILSGFLTNGEKADWNELSRHIMHIKDHCDYAEDIIISCIVPAEEGI